MAKQTEERTDMKVEFIQSGPRRRLASEIETVLYRIAQEALNNTVRHAHSRWARIELGFCDTDVTLVVTDDGVGFVTGSILKQGVQIRAWGLLGMQERVELVGGKLEIESAPGRGVRLAVTIPLEAKEERIADSGHAR
jgi:two-component system sensor histidine kinase DegS